MNKIEAISFDFWKTLATRNDLFRKERIEIFKDYFNKLDDAIIKAVISEAKQQIEEAKNKGILITSSTAYKYVINILCKYQDIGPGRYNMVKSLINLKYSYSPILINNLDDVLKLTKSYVGEKYFIASNTLFIDNANLCPWAPYVYTSENYMPKPHPQMLLTGCNSLGVEPKNLLHIGDSDDDLLAAESAGSYFLRATSKDIFTKLQERLTGNW